MRSAQQQANTAISPSMSHTCCGVTDPSMIPCACVPYVCVHACTTAPTSLMAGWEVPSSVCSMCVCVRVRD